MKGMFIICAVGIMMILGVGLAIANASPTSVRHHQCYAPCTVILPPGTLEDEFMFNYGWRNRHTPILDVWVIRPGEDNGR